MMTLLVLLCQSTVLLSLGFLALRVTQKRGPAVQTVVGRATLSGVALLFLLLPLSGRVAPVWRIPVSPPAPILGSHTEGSRKDTRALLAAPSAIAPPAHSVPAAVFAPSSVGSAHPEGAGNSVTTPPAPLAPRPPALGGPLRSNLLRSKEVGFFLPALLLLLWLAVCHYQLIRLRRAARPIADGPAAVLLAELTPHPPVLLTHPSVHSPFLAGTRRPAIFLPPSFAADFDPDALRAVFLHELAHRDRRDNLWTLAARLLTAVLWFQPLLWLLGRRLEQISEDACDQAVLAAHCPPRAYAACLLSLAERPPLARSQRTLTAGVAPFRSSVGRRISRILTLGVPIMPAVTLRLRLTIAALTIAAALGGAFLVSSAPAQTQPKPAPAVTPEMLRFHAEQQQDLSNLKAIGLAIAQYTQDHDEFLPDAVHWMDEISPYLADKAVFFDPFQPNTQRYGYAFNSSCSGESLAAFVHPSEAVAVFDSTSHARNASDTGQSLRTTAVGDALVADYLFEDGHVKMLRDPVQSRFTIQWDQRFVHMTPAHPSAGLLIRMHWRPSDSNTSAEKIFGAAQRTDQDRSQAQFLAGLTPVQGPGVVVTLRDSKKPFSHPKGGWPAGMMPPNIIHDSDINQVVNELKATGAEAIAVNDQRLVATSAIRCAGPTMYINNTPQEPPFVLKAIGDPKTLAGALTMPGGLGTILTDYDKAMFTVEQAATLTLPAYTGGDTPRYAKPVGAGAQASPNLPKRSFVVNYRVPSTGIHAVQVYIIDATGRRLASAKTYGPATAVSLPVNAVGQSVSFQIYDNGRLTKTQQIASGSAAPAPIIKPATTVDPARMHTIVGYGLVSWTLGKVRQCRAVTNSPASRVGVPTEWNSVILAVNGQRVPSSDAQFTAVCRSSPALHLLLASINRKKPYPVTVSAKGPFSVLTDAAAAEDQEKYLQSAQADAATAKAAQAHTNQQLAAAIQAALPQASASTLAKALNLEKRIGWSLSGQKLWIESKAASQKKNHPQSVAKFQRYEEEASARLVEATAEENALFPKTTGTPQALSRIHALAAQSYQESVTGMEKQIIAQVAESLMKQRGPAVTF